MDTGTTGWLVLMAQCTIGVSTLSFFLNMLLTCWFTTIRFDRGYLVNFLEFWGFDKYAIDYFTAFDDGLDSVPVNNTRVNSPLQQGLSKEPGELDCNVCSSVYGILRTNSLDNRDSDRELAAVMGGSLEMV
jgi:hypothetical protein